MNIENIKHVSYAVLFFILFSSMGLWAWNTLSELFSFPHAQYKHIVAAIIIGFFVRWIFFNSRHFGKSHKFLEERL